jgi:hypothetical protein
MADLADDRGVAGSLIPQADSTQRKEPENAFVENRSNVLSVAENGDGSIAGDDGLRGHARPDAYDA